MPSMSSCHHYFVGGSTVCGICRYNKAAGTLIDQHGVVHRAAWKDAIHGKCMNSMSYPERVLECIKSRRKVVTCIACVGYP